MIDLSKIGLLDICCGSGGFSSGFEIAGFNVKYGIDIWENVEKTFTFNHENAEFILDDFRNLKSSEFKGKIEGIIGSPPCIPFSRANFRKTKEDIENGLELVSLFLKWVKELKPLFWIMENVTEIIQYLKKLNVPKISIFNMADFGVPQKRIRMFCGNYSTPNQTHYKKGIQNSILSFMDNENDIKYWNTVLDSIKDLIFLESNKSLFINHENYNFNAEKNNPKYLGKYQGLIPIDLNQPSPTITDNHGNSNLIPNFSKYPSLNLNNIKKPKTLEEYGKYRRLTVRETARLQSYQDKFIFFDKKLANQFKMIGNSVSPLFSFNLGIKLREMINKEKMNLNFSLKEWYKNNIKIM